jgi:hypothetical protein
MPNCNADLLSVAQRQRGTCNPCFSPSTRRSDLAMTKATGVIKGDRLTMALITLAVRGKRPRCSGSVDHVLRTSDDQRDRAIAAPVAKS